MRTMMLIALVLISGTSAARADDPDIDCIRPPNTQAVIWCSGKELRRADDELNIIYKKALAYLVKIDKSRAEFGQTDVGVARSLDDAERAWLKYRDNNCDAMSAESLGGTAYSAYVFYCQIEMTRTRTKELKKLIGEND